MSEPPRRAPANAAAAAAAGGAAGVPPPMIRVWPAWMRLGHWALAGSVIGCLILFEGGRLHEALGYLALAVAAARLVAGLAGTAAHSSARFGRFVAGPRATLNYARAVWAHREARHLGHNPLGGWMVLALLLAALAAGASGALYVTDRFWGDALVHALHALAGWGLLVLVPLHVAGVVFTSVRQRENLARAMLDGRKRAPEGDDVPA